MSRVPRDPFSFISHRTLAQVARTAALQAEATQRRLPRIETYELAGLLDKAARYNPPTPPDQPA